MILRLTLSLPDDITYVRTARLLTRTLLSHHKVLREDIEDVETIIDELCSNVLRHAESEKRCFLVIVEYFPELATIDIKDTGKGFDVNDIPLVGTIRPDFNGGERVGGFGLILVRMLSTRLEFHVSDPEGTAVHAEKRLRYETLAAKREAKDMDKHPHGGADISLET